LLGLLLAARPPDALVLVVGVADTGQDANLHVAVADGAGLPAGWLTSATTGRTGYLQLVDVAPTVLATLGRPPPEVPLAGYPVTSRAGRPADLAEAVEDLVAADRAAVRARPVADGFLALLTVVQLGLFVAIVPLLRRRETERVPAGATAPGPRAAPDPPAPDPAPARQAAPGPGAGPGPGPAYPRAHPRRARRRPGPGPGLARRPRSPHQACVPRGTGAPPPARAGGGRPRRCGGPARCCWWRRPWRCRRRWRPVPCRGGRPSPPAA